MSQERNAVIEILAQIQVGSLRVGIVIWNGKVVEAAPAVGYMKGWTRVQVREHCRQRGWRPRVIWEMHRTDIGVRYLIGEKEGWPAVARTIVKAERVRQEPGGHHVRAGALELLPQFDSGGCDPREASTRQQ